MGGYYDEIEIEDMTFDPVKKVYHYPCPCGDRFEITKAQLRDYEDVATCPSCSLIIRVIYDPLDFEDYEDEEEDDDGSSVETGDEENQSDTDSVSKGALSGAMRDLKINERVEPDAKSTTGDDNSKKAVAGEAGQLMDSKNMAKAADAVHEMGRFSDGTTRVVSETV